MDNIEKYVEWYEDLCSEIGRAYQDALIIQSIEELNKKNVNVNHPGYFIIYHLCELSKRDLALSLYKIWFDENSEERIHNFNCFLHKEFNSQKNIPLKLSVKDNSPLVHSLKNIRDKYLAHLDSKRDETPVDVNALIQLLQEISEILNNIVDCTIDDRIKPISLSSKRQYINTLMGLSSMTKDFVYKED